MASLKDKMASYGRFLAGILLISTIGAVRMSDTGKPSNSSIWMSRLLRGEKNG